MPRVNGWSHCHEAPILTQAQHVPVEHRQVASVKTASGEISVQGDSVRTHSDRPSFGGLTPVRPATRPPEEGTNRCRFPLLAGRFLCWGLVAVMSTACASAAPTDVVPDLEYGAGQKLDVYFPTEGGPWPVVVLVHGAGLGPDSYQLFAELLADSGLVVFNADWRVLSPLLADSLGDVACAVRYAKDRASEFGGDPNKVVLVGHSTGAVYAGEVAVNGDAYPGACGLGTSALTEGLALISPAQVPGGRPWSHSSLGLNPDLHIVLIHGLNDDVVSPRRSERTSALLQDAGYEVTTSFMNGGHYDLVLVDQAIADVGSIPDDHPARAVAAQITDLAASLD